MHIRPAWLILTLTAQLATYFLNTLILRILLMGHSGTCSRLTLLKLSIVIMFVNQALRPACWCIVTCVSVKLIFIISGYDESHGIMIPVAAFLAVIDLKSRIRLK